MRRFLQVVKYSWKHAKEVSRQDSHQYRIPIFFDILNCYRKYKMWSNQYYEQRFWKLTNSERKIAGLENKKRGMERDAWQKDFRQNRKFLIKYSNIKYEKSGLREKRNKAYSKRFNAGKNLSCEYDVNISRQHYLNGEIKIGDNVLLAKHVFIDYSGGVVIGNDVQLTNGVIIETHHHDFHSDFTKSRDLVQKSKLIIGDGVVIGSRAIIMPGVSKIGKYSRIGAGAVVTKNVPDYSLVVGIPAKVVKYYTPIEPPSKN